MTTTDDLRALLTEPAPLPASPDLTAIRAGARRRVRRRRAAAMAGAGLAAAAVVVTAGAVLNGGAPDSHRVATASNPTVSDPAVGPTAADPSSTPAPPSGDVGDRLLARVRANLPGVTEATAYAHDRREVDEAIPLRPASDPEHAAQWDVIAYDGVDRSDSRVVLQAAWGPGTDGQDPETAACGAGAQFDHARHVDCTTSTVDGTRVDVVEGRGGPIVYDRAQLVAIAYRAAGRFMVVARENRSLTGSPASTERAWSLSQLRALVLDPDIAFPEPSN